MSTEDIDTILAKVDSEFEKSKLLKLRMDFVNFQVKELQTKIEVAKNTTTKDELLGSELVHEAESLRREELQQLTKLQKEHARLGEILRTVNTSKSKEGEGAVVYKTAPNLTIDKSAELLEKKFGNIWRQINVKFIEAPDTHHGFKAVAVALTSTVAELQLDPNDASASNISASASVLAEHNFPTYYVSHALVEAMLKSHPPLGMTWGQLELPFPAVLFMLPKDQVKEPDESSIVFVGYAKHQAKKEVKIIGLNSTFVNPWVTDRFTVFWSVGNCLQSQDCTFNADQPLQPNVDYIQEGTRKRQLHNQVGFGERPTEAEFSSVLCGLVANLILLKMARPEMVEPGENTKKRLKSGTPIHKPTWIGRKYEIIRRNRIVAGGHFTELDWRSGHYKVQHYGLGRKESKIIFIDPYIAYTRGLVRKVAV